MVEASDLGPAGADGSNSQGADRIAFDDPTRRGGALTSEPDAPEGAAPAQGLDASEGLGASEGAAAEHDQVGPGHPPRDTRWKKGGRSPNPRGRPRKDQTMLPDVRKAFEQALNKKISVTRGDRQVLMTRLELGFEQLLNQFAKGDRHARHDLMSYADKLGVDLLAKGGQAIKQALTPNNQAILDAFLARQLGPTAAKPADPAPATPESVSTPPKPALGQRKPAVEPVGPVAAPHNPAAAPSAPQARVFAPPELLDDDVVADGPAEPQASPPPAAEVTPEIQLPKPVPGKYYPKPPERMILAELRVWFPEWCALYGEAWSKQKLEKDRRASFWIRR